MPFDVNLLFIVLFMNPVRDWSSKQ
uniref:Uncharacterized protein MANES_S031900 n=1 Tax=Rhizophora mucronata TaxID=61149 RepID=A0A2P2NBX2_RHIMU